MTDSDTGPCSRRESIKASAINKGWIRDMMDAIDAALDDYQDQGDSISEEATNVVKIAMSTLITLYLGDSVVLLDSDLMKLVGHKDLTVSDRFRRLSKKDMHAPPTGDTPITGHVLRTDID